MKYIKIIALILGIIVILVCIRIFQIDVGPVNNPDIYIVESWLSSPYIEQANDYMLENEIDSVWIVGMNVPDTANSKLKKKEKITLPISLIGNGYIRANYNSNTPPEDTLLIDIEGYRAFGVGAFILIYINDEFALSKIISKRDTLKIPCPQETKNITLVFANDARCKKGEDRNIRIYSIGNVANVTTIEQKYGSVNILPDDLGLTEGLKTAMYLQELGCKPVHFVTVEGKAKGDNKTLQSSLLFKKWLSENHHTNKKLRINIFTTPQHARRTYINYKKALKNFADVGVIAFEKHDQVCEGLTAKQKFLSWADETASTIITYFYWLIHF